MLPPIWRYAKENRLYSQSDFFVRKYDSPTLGVIVALVDIVALIPYLVLQFKGLGIIAGVATVAAISLTGVNFHSLSWLPAPVQDLNIGIVALAVNFIVLVVVSLATRLAAEPARAAAE